MRNLKKIIVFLLCLCFILGFSSCNEQKQYGEIKPVKTTEDEQSDENIFTPVEDNLGYDYVEYINKRSYMKFNVPSNWGVRRVTDRHLELRSQSNDPYLPDCNIQLFFNYSQYTKCDSASDCVNIFKSDLKNASYLVKNKQCTINKEIPDEMDIDTSFTGGKNEYTSLATSKKLHITSGASWLEDTTVTKYDYYVKWAGTPCVFSIAVTKEKEKYAKRLLRYMVSSITYTKQNIDNLQTISDENVKVSIPAEFEQQNDSNSYIAPIDKNTGYSGMAVQLYEYNKEDGKMSEKLMTDYYGKQLFEQAFQANNTKYSNMYYSKLLKNDTIAGSPTEIYASTATIIESTENASDFYTNADTWYMQTYVLEHNDKQILVNFIYEASQYKLAEKLIYTIENSIKII